MRLISSKDRDFAAIFKTIRMRGRTADPGINKTVASIIADVAENGDAALFKYTKKFDGFTPTSQTLEVTGKEKRELASRVPANVLDLFALAAKRIEAFHERQASGSWSYSEEDGVKLGQIVRPLGRVGVYCPGGLAFYPSSVLMSAIPAKVAGVPEVVLVTPARQGRIDPMIAAAARISGVDRIFRIGGAQAIAALAYGTETVPRVDKIVGPGNVYVAVAKKMVFGQVGIDMIAGPSEICIIADNSADPSMIAADLLSQAEHDRMASAVLLTPDEDIARLSRKSLETRLKGLSRGAIARESIRDYGLMVVTTDMKEAVQIANEFAPEHLELMVSRPGALIGKIKNAGAVFTGNFTPEAIGDYLAGPSHVLPTGGSARFSSPLGVYDFEKRMSLVSFSRRGLKKYSGAAEMFATLEGLDAHCESVRARFVKKS